MKATIVLADTGRPQGSALNLLNAGWAFTQALPWPEVGAWTLPAQAIAVFFEADLQEQNRPLSLELRLVDDDGRLAKIAQDPEPGDAVVTQTVMVPPVPGAPSGTPGQASFLINIDAGGLIIHAPRRRYVWTLTVDGQLLAEAGFWVEGSPELPPVGGS